MEMESCKSGEMKKIHRLRYINYLNLVFFAFIDIVLMSTSCYIKTNDLN